MDARPVLERVARGIAGVGLEAVLIGNAAAALRGAPVTTIDLDFFFHRSPGTVGKLKRLANRLNGTMIRPHYPVSGLYRISVEEEGLQLDFMGVIHGAKSYYSVRSRANWFPIGDTGLWVASLVDILKSKRAAGRPRDRAVLETLEKTLRAEEESKPKKGAGGATKRK